MANKMDQTTKATSRDGREDRSAAKAIRRADAIAKLLDNRFKVPGTKIRFGYDAIIGLIPGVGDALSAGVSAYVVIEAIRQRIGIWPVTKMIFNIVIDFLVGLVPGIDLIFDVAFKANVRNAKILTDTLKKQRSD